MAPQGQRTAPWQVVPDVQSESSQQAPAAREMVTQVPSPPAVHAAPSQRLPLLQPLSSKQQPMRGAIVHVASVHALVLATLTPTRWASQTLL